MSKTITTINPATGQTLRNYPLHSPEQINALLAQAANAAERWRREKIEVRRDLLKRIASLLRRDQEKFAQLMQEEMGKSLAEGKAEVEKCAATAEYFYEHGPGFLEPIPAATEAQKSYISFEPLGTVLAIMPWNFPFWQAIRCAVPALLAGNTLVLKHASNVSGCSLALEALVAEAGGREHLLQSVLVKGADALPLIARPEISAVSFTGSTEAGREIAAAAGQALKKCVLELGGSDPYLVLADADIPAAAKTCASSRLINAGQSCIAAKRFIVEKKVFADFERAFVAAMKAAPIAPLARVDLRDQLHAQVEKTVQEGARLVCGGKIPAGKGAHYPATVLSGVKPGMTAFVEECFGPVATLVEARDEEEAIRLANDSAFGLGAAVFTRNLGRGEQIAREELVAGSCFVNALVKSDARLPFGGVKESGYGRELSAFGIREFVNIKTVYIA